jgi:hypothetical protein
MLQPPKSGLKAWPYPTVVRQLRTCRTRFRVAFRRALRRQPQSHHISYSIAWLLAYDPRNLGLQRHESGHLLLPVPRDVVGGHQAAKAVTEHALRGFVCYLEISQRGFSIKPA